MSYQPPVEDILSALRHAAGHGARSPLDDDLARAALTEAGRLAAGRLAPTNLAGDRDGAVLTAGGVQAASGFRDAYSAIMEGGWLGLPFSEAIGGQGLPRVLSLAVMEMFHAANTSLALCPMLSLGAIEAIAAHGSEEQRRLYLPKLVSGEWTGTMNLSEPQAGSDVGALTTRAEPLDDGSFAITGQKIYITWGDHDLTENIIHLVLARLPDAPAGAKGVSLFLCPKFLLDSEGRPGERNAVTCIGLESKLGIHGSPTCVMEYAGARGWLIGEPNRGLAAMFTMMNSARVNVGIQGVALAEAAYQAALAHAQGRVQGQSVDGPGRAAIVSHPDVFRMLLTMRAKVMAARAICYACGHAADQAASAASETDRAAARLREDLLTPIAKAWSTDVAVEAASLGVQVHGGMGFMDGTLAAQLYRDSRIGPIYEGTNGIQAIDLVGRKLGANQGEVMTALIRDLRETARAGMASNDAKLSEAARLLDLGLSALDKATRWMSDILVRDRPRGLSGATPYLKLAGAVVGAEGLVARALGHASSNSERDLSSLTACYFAQTELSAYANELTALVEASETASLARSVFLSRLAS